MTITQLKQQLKSFGLPVTGKKKALVERLTAAKRNQAYVGQRIAKRFPNDKNEMELFVGNVTEFIVEDGYWKVVYDDGDCEEMEEKDLKQAIALHNATSMTSSNDKMVTYEESDDDATPLSKLRRDV